MPELRIPAGDGLIDWGPAIAAVTAAGAGRWAECLPAQLARVLETASHGELERWLAAVRDLPVIPTRRIDLGAPAVTVGEPADVTDAQRGLIRARLQALQPWRKGPFELFGVDVDAEWRCDLKWGRVAPHLAPVLGRRVLDVGCGNGYYGWRLCGAGARAVIGIDPNQRYLAQYLAVERLLAGAPGVRPPFHMLPVGLEDLPPDLSCFDTVLSMGVIYHRRDPPGHLRALRGLLRPGGQVVVESLVIGGGTDTLLVPDGRYARMRNVWSIPSAERLQRWVSDAGFANVRLVDLSPTTTREQRRTAWMVFQSLADFLDPDDPSRTVEGYSAPVRAICTATC